MRGNFHKSMPCFVSIVAPKCMGVPVGEKRQKGLGQVDADNVCPCSACVFSRMACGVVTVITDT